MASRSSKSSPQARTPSSTDRKEPPEVVDPRWLLRAALAVVALAVVCGIVTVWIAFYKTQWQLVLEPSRMVMRTPAAVSLPFENVRFSPGSSGQPELDGWWIPAETSSPTALLLHSGSGNMADVLPLAAALHQARLNVLVFDYRGFGQSAGDHPSEATMKEDATAALAFVQDAHHTPLNAVIPVGEGLGASLAVGLAAAHPEMPAIILSSPRGDTEEEAKLAARSHLVPFGLLFHERFPLADKLHTLTTPKLILADGKGQPSVLALRAGDPKMTVEGLGGNQDALQSSLRRFLDSYVSRPPQELRPEGIK